MTADQKSIAASEKRLTGGFDEAFFSFFFLLSRLVGPDARACPDFVTGVARYRGDRHLHAESF